MSPSLLSLLGYAAWYMLLLAMIAGLRGAISLSGSRAPNTFLVTGEDVSPFSARLCRAHANVYENLPAFAAIVMVATASGQQAITDPLAPCVLAARVAQSCIHLVSTSVPAVLLRFACLVMQLAIQVWWVYQLSTGAAR